MLMYPLSRQHFPLKSIDRFLPDLLKPLVKKRGFREATLLTDWKKAVGVEYADALKPSKISYSRTAPYTATLYLTVEPQRMLEMQYSAPQILDRINTYLGCKAITGLKLQQSMTAGMTPSSKNRGPITAKIQESITLKDPSLVENILDDNLKQALIDLGMSMGL